MIEEACVRGLRSAALRGVGEIVKQIDNTEPYPPVDTGAMRQSVAVDNIPGGAELSVNSPNAASMEYGTRPHMPPFGPILIWVRRKFGLGAEGRKKKGSRKGKKPSKVSAGKAASGGGGGGGATKSGEPKKPSIRKSGPRRNKVQRIAQNEKLAYGIAKKVQWKIFHYGIAPRGFFSRAMVVIAGKYAPIEIRHELKALEKSL